MILGIDEVGRGPWAGPLVIGAVVLDPAYTIEGLTDSKKLSAARRERFDAEIREHALGFGLGWVHAEELDEIGLSQALRVATIRAVEQVSAPYHEIIIDGTQNFLSETAKGSYVTVLKKADLLIPSVSAASIIAKVARDKFMEEQAATYPEYGFASHVGYGTAAHKAAIDTHGVTPLHRTSFAPIKLALTTTDKTTKQKGDAGEDRASEYLQAEGYEIIARNWRTKWCEIDIVASKNDIVYFVEVKYRKDDNHGGGLAAITSDKQRRMHFAAELYLQKYPNKDARLAVVALSDELGEVLFLEIE